ncbi:MAG: hypothetical protein M3Y85_13140 [Bacteroidota bacterium]|nr:hypothetical protein [Bacteroidota bacterium]
MKGKGQLTIIFILSTLITTAQQFGAFPPSTKWQQIKTDTARIIFEEAIDSQAQNIAAIIHQLNRQNPNSLGDNIRQVSVLLHKNTTAANGYVALGPFRSEYYLIPASNIFEFGNTPWPQTLAVHEYRHVHQFSNFNKGLSHLASILFGQEGQAVFNAIAIPDWFFEGDAVHSETIHTLQGRGRSPHFFDLYKSLWHEGRDYSWMKLRNGSLKDRVPDHYPLGYMLVNYGYLKYGPDFWKKVTEDALTLRGFFGFFGGSIKRYSGKSFKTFREEAMLFYSHEVSTRRDAVRKRESVTDYLFPQQIGNDSLLYIKKSFKKLPAFFIRTNGGEQYIKLRNITAEDWFAYRKGTIAYTAYNTSARWSLTNYSNIVLLDINSKEEKQITRKAKYFTPDISPDGTKIIAVAFTGSLSNELHLLDREGTVLQKLKAAPGALFVHPRFIDDENFVVAVRNTNSTMSMEKRSFLTGKIDTVIPAAAATLGYPFVKGNKLYFVSSQTGNDEVFELDLTSNLPVRKIRQLTFGQTGNYFPSATNDTLTYSTVTSNGYHVQRAALKNIKSIEITGDDLGKKVIPFKIALDEAVPNVLANNTRQFPTLPYKKSTGLFNFHSWRPNYTDPEITYSLYSDNILNTLSNEIFYRYNINETSHAVGFNTFYGALFPVLNAGVNYTFDRTIKTTARTYTLNQFEGRVGYNIPLNFTGGNTYKFFNAGSNFVYSRLMPSGIYKNLLSARTVTYLHHYISFTQQLPKAIQHIFPKFGYTINIQHRHLLKETGFQSLGGVRLYLPSIANHSIVLAANIQETDTANSTFSNRFANSRGYNDFYFSRMWRLSGNYHMPLIYPDWGVAGILYFLRVRSNVFYDYTKVYSRNKMNTAEQRSVGGELYFDTKWFNTTAVTIGFRLSHLLDNDFSGNRPNGTNHFEIIVPLDLIPK